MVGLAMGLRLFYDFSFFPRPVSSGSPPPFFYALATVAVACGAGGALSRVCERIRKVKNLLGASPWDFRPNEFWKFRNGFQPVVERILSDLAKEFEACCEYEKKALADGPFGESARVDRANRILDAVGATRVAKEKFWYHHKLFADFGFVMKKSHHDYTIF